MTAAKTLVFSCWGLDCMDELEKAKRELATRIERLISRRQGTDAESSLLIDWVHTVKNTRIEEFEFSFDPRAIHDHDAGDEMVFSKAFSFYGDSFLEENCRAGSHLARENCMPIGSVDGDDEFIYICNDLSRGIALLHHDDVFLADDLDAVVYDSAARLETSLTAFVDCLKPPARLAKFLATGDASKWLVVEDLGSVVRYEMNLDDNWRDGEQAFDSETESEEYFYRVIERGLEIARLSVLQCSPSVWNRVESLLTGNDSE